jgi:hypothetical protein
MAADQHSADYIFVEVKAKDKKGAVSRGSKISHALRRHHREARRERARRHSISPNAATSIKARNVGEALSLRGSALSTPELSLQTLVRPSVQSREADQTEELRLPIPEPKALNAILGQGRLDPFNVFPVDNVSSYVHEVLDHGEHPSQL